MEAMSQAAARRIAKHLIGSVHKVAAGNGGVTWGYNHACGPKQITTRAVGDYHKARAERAEHVRELTGQLLDGEAPEWATLAFVW